MLLKREEELTTALEEEVASRQRERREHHHADRQAGGQYPRFHILPLLKGSFGAVCSLRLLVGE